jgi:isopentenyl-diphosphate delta-isomerase
LELIEDLLTIVDKNDQVIGYLSKNKCHRPPGIIHRAFSIFIFNNKGEFLLQKRSSFKDLWPGIWSNSCCSHPKKGQKVKKAAEERLAEELGFTCPLKFMGKVKYQACWQDKGCEKEITYVYTGKYNGLVKPDPKEVKEIKWLDLPKLKTDIKKYPDRYTPWMRKIIQKFPMTKF